MRDAVIRFVLTAILLVSGVKSATVFTVDDEAAAYNRARAAESIASCAQVNPTKLADQRKTCQHIQSWVTSDVVTVSASGLFTAGDNTEFPHVLTATTLYEGEPSKNTQQFTMNVVKLPDDGASFRVLKTMGSGDAFLADERPLSLGSNTFSVNAVSFDRTVKFLFSSGEIQFDALSLNGIDVF